MSPNRNEELGVSVCRLYIHVFIYSSCTLLARTSMVGCGSWRICDIIGSYYAFISSRDRFLTSHFFPYLFKFFTRSSWRKGNHQIRSSIGHNMESARLSPFEPVARISVPLGVQHGELQIRGEGPHGDRSSAIFKRGIFKIQS
jgi:hypothetical protein